MDFSHACDIQFTDSPEGAIAELLERARTAAPWIVERLQREFAPEAVRWRIKRADRVAEKTEDRRIVMPEYSPAQMNDLLGVRVIVASWSEAAGTIARAVRALDGTDCTVANSLLVPQIPTGYRAITATIRAGNGYVFQLEVMTTSAEDIIEGVSHPVYVRRRTLDVEIARARTRGEEPDGLIQEYRTLYRQELDYNQQIAREVLDEIDRVQRQEQE